MDTLVLLLGIGTIASLMELAAMWRHKREASELRGINFELSCIRKQTNLRRPEHIQQCTALLREEFPDISDLVNEEFAESVYNSSFHIEKQLFILMGEVDKKIDDKWKEFDEFSREMDEFTYRKASPKIAEHLLALPKEDVIERLKRVRNGIK